MAVISNDHHYSPLSDAGARSMKLRHFSPARGKRRRGGIKRWRGRGGCKEEVERIQGEMSWE